ncbi:MAG TPA: Wzz/FepE/Etk N-terminal domain-containing protein [Solirubrobacteraceae bacterium]|nr:Wzz/FepE/Etk N-terminal domain-containing protein [Solirubrobacteraceae bacterium]
MAEEPATTRRIWPTLWREKYIILGSIIVMIGLALVYTLTAAKVYQASAIIQVNLSTSNPGTTDTTAANQALAQNYATLLVSPGFLKTVQPHVEHGKLSVDELQSRLTATALPQGALVQLDATGPSPAEAQTVDQQVINGFLANLQSGAAARTTQLQAQLQAQISNLSNQISALSALPATPARTEQINGLKASRVALIGQNATLVANGLAQGTSASLSAPPVASASPISPRHSLDLLGGALLGVVLGVGLAWARASLRPAIHSADDVSALVDLPLLASIPLKARFKADDPSLAEAYRVLHANLMFALRARGVQVVTVAGFNPRVGKTSTVEGLARAVSRGDRQVLVVDGDMRAATLSQELGYPDHPGIVDVLQGRLALEDALVNVEEGLWLLPSVSSRVNAATLLAGSATFGLMAELRERFDVVLIDSPPLSGLADGLILASHSDVVVLVVRAGVTRPRDLASVSNGMLNATPILGTVVFEDVPVEPYYTGSRPASKAGPASVPG